MKRLRITTRCWTVVAATMLGLSSPLIADCGVCKAGESAVKPKCAECDRQGQMCQKCVAKKMKMKSKHHHHHAWAMIPEAICVVHPTQGHTVSGTVRFIQAGPGIKIVADVEGLSPNSRHAIHIHEYGDCTSADGKSAGGHYDPQGHPHALPSSDIRHAGDLGNLQADAEGKAHYELTVDNICIVGHKNPILGRAVIIHEHADDGGQPTGNAGPRIACGVIGVAHVAATQPAVTAPATQPSHP